MAVATQIKTSAVFGSRYGSALECVERHILELCGKVRDLHEGGAILEAAIINGSYSAVKDYFFQADANREGCEPQLRYPLGDSEVLERTAV
jgi:hypothetical protein